MTLYCIMTVAQAGVHASDLALERACHARNISYQRLICEDVLLDDLRNAAYDASDLVYRISTSNKAVSIESLLTHLHPQLTTIYSSRTQRYPFRNFRELSQQLTSGLEIIPTQLVDSAWAQLTAEAVDERIAALGGYPIVMKRLGLSHGQGVSLVQSSDELRTAVQQLSASDSVILRKYLADYHHYRLIVVAGKVVSAIEYHKPDDDFRTNAMAEPDVSAVAVEDLEPATIKLATDAAALRHSLLAGVDILVDKQDNIAYLAEVNVPCYFPRAEGVTGVDIAGQIVDALLAKAQSQEPTS